MRRYLDPKKTYPNNLSQEVFGRQGLGFVLVFTLFFLLQGSLLLSRKALGQRPMRPMHPNAIVHYGTLLLAKPYPSTIWISRQARPPSVGSGFRIGKTPKNPNPLKKRGSQISKPPGTQTNNYITISWVPPLPQKHVANGGLVRNPWTYPRHPNTWESMTGPQKHT